MLFDQRLVVECINLRRATGHEQLNDMLRLGREVRRFRRQWRSANASTLYSDWCADGASVHFTTVANGGHATTEIIGFVGAFNFVKAAFTGTVASGCSTSTELADSLDPLALGVQLEPVIVQLLNALAVAGRNDINIKNNLQTLNETVEA